MPPAIPTISFLSLYVLSFHHISLKASFIATSAVFTTLAELKAQVKEVACKPAACRDSFAREKLK